MARKNKPPRREATHQVGLRVPESLLRRVDAHAERLRRETGLVTLSRTDAALARIRKLRQRGLTVRAIAEALNAEGVPARGARWYHQTVHRVLRREVA